MYEVNPLLSWIYDITGMYVGLLAYKIAVGLFAVSVEHYLSTLELDYSKENTVIEKWKRVLIKIADTRTILYGIGIGGYFAAIFNIIHFSGAI
jgi:tetrahydromethanopterin S-methyltransferase subunit G